MNCAILWCADLPRRWWICPQSRLLDEAFAEASSKRRVVYWPFAMADDADLVTCDAWLRRTFEPLGVNEVDTWASLEARDLDDLQGAGGLYIGGGNTYRLLQELQMGVLT